VNFYKRHIGDYIKDAGHLSLLEHGVYCRLLDVYYTREAPIPEAKAARLIGAKSKDEVQAVQSVLDEFFTLEDGHWHQKRADEEIGKAAGKSEGDETEGQVPARSSKAERQKRYRDRKKAMCDALREHGITMPFESSMDDLQDALLRLTVTSQRNANVTGDGNEGRNVTATISHKPLATSHKPKREGDGDAAANSPAPARNAQIAVLLRSMGIQTTPSHPLVCMTWANNPKVTDYLLTQAASTAKQRKPNQRLGAEYLEPIVTDLLKASAGGDEEKPAWERY
jgi:uncharacterized protein YdaU (DUF1376 family)